MSERLAFDPAHRFVAATPERVWVQSAGTEGALRGLGTVQGRYWLYGVVTWVLVRLDVGVQTCVKPVHLAHATAIAMLPSRRTPILDIPPPPRPWDDRPGRHPEPAA